MPRWIEYCVIVIELPYRISGNVCSTVSGTVSVTVTALQACPMVPRRTASPEYRNNGITWSGSLSNRKLILFVFNSILPLSLIFNSFPPFPPVPLFPPCFFRWKKHSRHIIAHNPKPKSLCMIFKHNLSGPRRERAHQKGCLARSWCNPICRAFGAITDPNRQINPRCYRGYARTCSIRTRTPVGQAWWLYYCIWCNDVSIGNQCLGWTSWECVFGGWLEVIKGRGTVGYEETKGGWQYDWKSWDCQKRTKAIKRMMEDGTTTGII